MANFMKAFEDQREDYLSHYGKKGMKWGVITSEYEPVGDQPGQEDSKYGLGLRWPGTAQDPDSELYKQRQETEYSQQDQESMQQSADAIRQADAESVKDKRKRIVKNIVKGVAIGAIVAGIAAGAVKGYAKKQTGEKQDLATSIGIVGQKFRSAPGQIGDAVKKGFNMDTGATKAANEAEAARKRDERVQAFKNAAGKVGSAVGTAGSAVGKAAGKVGQAVGTAAGNVKKSFEARSQAAKELRESINESKNMNIQFGPWADKSRTKKMDFGAIVSERAKNANEANNMDIQNIQFGPWADKSRTKKIDLGSIREEAEEIRKRNERVQAFKNAAGKVGSAVGSSVRESIDALQRWQTIDPKTGMLRNRYRPNGPKRYEETPRSRIYRG